jgi:hypothetical protein
VAMLNPRNFNNGLGYYNLVEGQNTRKDPKSLFYCGMSVVSCSPKALRGYIFQSIVMTFFILHFKIHEY